MTMELPRKIKRALAEVGIVEPKNMFIASLQIASGLIWFFNNPKKAVGMIAGIAAIVFSIYNFIVRPHLIENTFEIIKAVPKTTQQRDSGGDGHGSIFRLELFPTAYAQSKGRQVRPKEVIRWMQALETDSIVVNGEFFGFSDTNYKIWKLKGEPVLFFWEKTTGATFLSNPLPQLEDKDKLRAIQQKK